MKKIITVLLIVLVTNLLVSQSSEKIPPNKTVVRLIIQNQNGDILMKKSSLGWVTIATFYTERQSFNEVIDSLTNMYGIKITKPNLGGVFTYKYNFKKSADTRLLYTAKYIDGDIKQGKNGYHFTWFTKKEAIEKLRVTVPSLSEMIQHILNNPNQLWGGSFYVTRDDKGKLDSKMIEKFYPLRGNE